MQFNTSNLAIIVGGSSGIGFETAKQLAEQGVSVLIVGNQQDKLQPSPQSNTPIRQPSYASTVFKPTFTKLRMLIG